MLRSLRNLFASRAPAVGNPAGVKVALSDVLDCGWFDLWYQPKVELRGKRLVGAEALVRARHPRYGVLNPGAFLPEALEADMLALTERVIVTAMHDWSDFAEDGLSLPISVNASISVLSKLSLASLVRKHRPKSESWPGLILEVTENEVLRDFTTARRLAEAVRACHCRFALDDSSASSASLSRLKELPFTELKIDRSYVSNCHNDRANAALCEAIIDLGARFGLTTVAEGIESVYEYHKLQGLGCDVGQGYLFSKPLSKHAFVETALRRLAVRNGAPGAPYVA
jgi:EAL domain-containing protein (putative c-di-GMP-specific phosphodiesterase class I)